MIRPEQFQGEKNNIKIAEGLISVGNSDRKGYKQRHGDHNGHPGSRLGGGRGGGGLGESELNNRQSGSRYNKEETTTSVGDRGRWETHTVMYASLDYQIQCK